MPESKWAEFFRFTSTCKYLTNLHLYSSNLGEVGRYLVLSWADNPTLQNLDLCHCSIPEEVWTELLQSLSSCKQLSHLNLSGNTIGEAGRYLAQSITSWGDNPPLQQLNLYSCSIPEQVWPELLQSLSSCKQLIDLALSDNDIGKAGRYLAQSITSWGDNPPLQGLYLCDCSIPEQVWPELLQSLSSCKQLTDLNLSDNSIDEAGHYLAQSITSWGDNPPLQNLYLRDCSIPEQVWPELFLSLSSCKQLTELRLSGNTIGEAGSYLTQSITSWGDNPVLQKLNLGCCSIPEQVWPELLQSLSSCKQLIDLALSDNDIGKAGRYLAQSITSWGDNPPLQGLYLCDCSIPEQVWPELLQSLSSCKQLTDLNLSDNSIDEAGHYLAQSITSWGDNPPLQNLYLRDCSIPEQVWPELFLSLSSCKQLTELRLSGNTIGEAGSYLTQSITSWGDNPVLQKLNLGCCSIPEQVWPELLQSLSPCKQLIDLALSDNDIGKAGRYLAQSITSWGDNPPLQGLYLCDCSIPEQVWPELLQSLSSCKQLTDLNLSDNSIDEAGHYLAQSITSWGDNPPLQNLYLRDCSIPEQVWPELFLSLSSCKQLTELRLSGNTIGEAGSYLTQSITSWGDNPVLQKLNLGCCSIPEQVWPELLQSLSSCKQLIDLALSDNNIGKAGRYLAQSITSWGDNPPLRGLYLCDCSIPEQVWLELLQSLSSCEQLTYLNFSGNNIGEAGCYLAQSIASSGDNPPLEKLHLNSCSIPEQVWPELLQSLSSCKQLTDLDLSGNTIGKAGHYLAQSITSWGDNPPLQQLNLYSCSIPEQVWPELLQSLSSCKQLIDLALSDNDIGKAGRYLAQSITSWGDNPPLQGLYLCDCSIPEQVWPELLQSLSSCKQLTDLNLSDNSIDEAGHYLAQSITSWGDNPPLQNLYLCDCSIPEQVWPELLQSLSSCEQLTYLNFSGNNIGEAGCYLAQSIASSGDNPPLEKLHLNSCSIPEQVWPELLQSLSSCKQLTELRLSGNTIGEAGSYLTQSITSWGDNPVLQKLNLGCCSIPEQVWPELLQSLSFCKQLTGLNLSGNTIGEAGRYLAQSITSWGDNPPSEKLSLINCSIPEQVWPELLQSLSSCKDLCELNLSRNTLTGCFFHFLSDANSGLTSLKSLNLDETAINETDIQHLTQLIQANKLPHLVYLHLRESWTPGEEELEQLEQLKKACASHPNGTTVLFITPDNSEEEEVKLQASLQENKQVQKIN